MNRNELNRNDINRVYTNKVTELIGQGYQINAFSKGGAQGARAYVDLYKGDDLIRVTLEDDYVGDWDCIYITVGRCTSQNRNAFETEIWNIRLETISELRYFEVRENRYVLNRVLGTK